MVEQALNGVRILDMTHYITGPFATKLLAGYGADVLKVEKPGGGDPSRKLGPFFHDEVSLEKSGLFLYLNMGKRGITLNLKHPTGVNIFRELVKETDILVESFRPGVMASFGLDYPILEKINPKLVMVSISNFGQTGPYRDYRASELILEGMGEAMYMQGRHDREPVKNGETIAQYTAGISSLVAIMGAYMGSAFQGIGQYVDISIMETLTSGGPSSKNICLIAYQYCGEEQPRFLTRAAGYPHGAWPCADGYINLFGGTQYFPRVIKMLGSPDFLKDPKWNSPTTQADPVLKEEFEAYFLGWLMKHNKRDIARIAQDNRDPCVVLQDVSDVAGDPHLNERGFFVEISHPVVGKLKYPGRPFIMSMSPFEVKRPAPLLGEHNKDVYSQLGYSGEDLVRLAERGII